MCPTQAKTMHLKYEVKSSEVTSPSCDVANFISPR
jgi:hypothetical protein